jgi:hypothetical protein
LGRLAGDAKPTARMDAGNGAASNDGGAVLGHMFILESECKMECYGY